MIYNVIERIDHKYDRGRKSPAFELFTGESFLIFISSVLFLVHSYHQLLYFPLGALILLSGSFYNTLGFTILITSATRIITECAVQNIKQMKRDLRELFFNFNECNSWYFFLFFTFIIKTWWEAALKKSKQLKKNLILLSPLPCYDCREFAKFQYFWKNADFSPEGKFYKCLNLRTSWGWTGPSSAPTGTGIFFI